MTDRPIPFSAPMVAALRAGTKTQTRRVVKRPTDHFHASYTHLHGEDGRFVWSDGQGGCQREAAITTRPGDRLWVREAYYQRGHWAPVDGARTQGGRQKWGFVADAPKILFDPPDDEIRLGRHSADPEAVRWHKRLGRFMPRSASRMTLLVTDVRVQRLQDISEKDAIAEGMTFPEGMAYGSDPIDAYHGLWDSINGTGSWAANPWVVAYSFTVERRNIDEAPHG